MAQIPSTQNYGIGIGSASTSPFITQFINRSPTSNDISYPIQSRWINTTTSDEYVLQSFSTVGGITTANWMNLSTGSVDLLTFNADSGSAVPASAVMNFLGSSSISTSATGDTVTTTINAAYVGQTSITTLGTIATGVWNGTTIAIANGGTNATSMTNTDGVVYYDGTRLVTTTVGTSGQILTSNGAGVAPSFQAAGSSGITTINGDSGSATGSTVTIKSNVASFNAGSSVNFTGSSATLTFNVTDANGNTAIGNTSKAGSGTNNTLLGYATQLNTGSYNVFIGYSSGSGHHCTGNSNVAVGALTVQAITSGQNNCAIGEGSLSSVTSGSYNCTVGSDTLDNLTTGTYNCCIGQLAGDSYLTSESHNILINHAGIATESHVLRIGSGTGTGTQQLNKAFISGINGVTSSNALMVTINSSTDQLGVAAIAGQGFITVNVQTFIAGGTYTPTANMTYCTIEVQGSGGGGAGGSLLAGGGGAGGYAKKTVTAATIGASQVVTVGGAGTGGTSTNNGGNGNSSSVGSIVSATGGTGGNANGAGGGGGAGGSGSSGDINLTGQSGGNAFAYGSTAGANGGSCFYGQGGQALANTTSAGTTGTGYGGGGGGGAGASSGGNGAPGIVIITEYII